MYEKFVDQTVTMKLNSGEELIAKVLEVDLPNILVSTPVSIAPGQHGMSLVPSMFTAEPSEKVMINTSCITMVALTEESIKFKYVEATTGIKLPEKKLILG